MAIDGDKVSVKRTVHMVWPAADGPDVVQRDGFEVRFFECAGSKKLDLTHVHAFSSTTATLEHVHNVRGGIDGTAVMYVQVHEQHELWKLYVGLGKVWGQKVQSVAQFPCLACTLIFAFLVSRCLCA